MKVKKWLLGLTKKNLYGTCEPIFLEDFRWDCGWYWGGGYITNSNILMHFESCFLDVPDARGHSLGNFFTPWAKIPDHVQSGEYAILKNGASVWEPLEFFLDNAKYSSNEWWRIKDLFKQFYTMKNTAEAFQYGGHCTSFHRTEAEIDKDMAHKINEHLRTVIIPEIQRALNHYEHLE